MYSHGACIREDTTRHTLYLMFSGHEFDDGGEYIREVLREERVPASFFLTGDFYRDSSHVVLLSGLLADGHFLGGHSDRHLLYASWEDRESTLVSEETFLADLQRNYEAMQNRGIARSEARFFLPPYEWYNRQIADWIGEEGLVLINYTPGTRSTADYTTPGMGTRYVGSDSIYRSILLAEERLSSGLNGFFLLLHIGTDPQRTDKFWFRLRDLVRELRRRGYTFARFEGTPGR